MKRNEKKRNKTANMNKSDGKNEKSIQKQFTLHREQKYNGIKMF